MELVRAAIMADHVQQATMVELDRLATTAGLVLAVMQVVGGLRVRFGLRVAAGMPALGVADMLAAADLTVVVDTTKA
jgi:hypothetical protein